MIFTVSGIYNRKPPCKAQRIEAVYEYCRWYNPLVPNVFLIQMIGVVLTVAGLIAMTASANLFGTPMSLAEKRRASDEWNRRKTVFRLPLPLETIVSSIFFLGGIGILIWSNFEHCAFLEYWLPSLPDVARAVLSCM